MDWFKRYGIPGAYFIALSGLWSFALHPCLVKELIDEKNVNLLIAGVGLFFVPIGYLICIFEQFIYLRWRWPRIGIIGRAMLSSGKFTKIDFKKEKEFFLEAESCIWAIKDSNSNVGIDLERQKFIQAWLRGRNDILTINGSLIVETILVTIGFLITCVFVDKNFLQSRMPWVISVLSVTLFVIIIAAFSWYTILKQNVKLLTELFRIMNVDNFPH